jgi:hypothetical protein
LVDTLTLTGYALFVLLMIVNRFGGPQVVYYRIRGIAYFIDYIRGPDKRYRRRLFPMSIIQKHSPAMFHYGRGDYQVPEAEAAIDARGAPMWFHAWDESRCIPQYMDTIEVTNEDTGERYTQTQFREKVPPEVIRAGFLGMAASAVNIGNLDQEKVPNKFPFFVVPILIIIAIGVLVGVWYEYNTTCALHTVACR